LLKIVIGREGGGVAIYYRSILNVINREDLIPEQVEAVCHEVIKPKSKHILIASVYRPPSSKIEILNEIEVFSKILIMSIKN
jgi:hypothetical protein